MTSSMREILETTRSFIQVKRAEFEGKKADKELDMGGAGDDSPLTRGHALEADESALEPKKEPAVSDDANAEPASVGGKTTGSAEGKAEGNLTDRVDKLESEDAAPVNLKTQPAITNDAYEKPAEDQAAKLCNQILTDIRKYAESAKVAAKPVEKKAVAKPVEKKAVATPVAKKAEEKPADQKVEAKQADGLQLELTTDVLAKIAAMILSTEEGAEYVEQTMAKAAGAEAAYETLSFLAAQSEAAEKQAAYAQGQADAEAMVKQAIYERGKSDANTEKKAAVNVYEKLGQALADASIEDLMSAGDMGGGMGGAPAGVPAEAGGMPPDVAPEELAAAESGGGEGGEITEEELGEALTSLVEDGTITPEEASEVMNYVASAGGEAEGVPGAEAPVEEAPVEEAPVAEAPAEEAATDDVVEEDKEAKAAEKKAGKKVEKNSAVDKSAALVNAIKKIQSTKQQK